MAATAVELKTKIEQMKKVRDAKTTSESLKATLNKSIEKAQEVLDDIQAESKEVKKPSRRASSAIKTAHRLSEKTRKQNVKKKVTSAIAKINFLLAHNKEVKAAYKGTPKGNIVKDSKRPAKHEGKRVSEDGNVYYEHRANRTDVTHKKFPLLEEGGPVSDSKSMSEFKNKVKAAMKQPGKWHFINEEVDGKTIQLKMYVGVKEVDVQIYKINNLEGRMPKNYAGKRETEKMIFEALSSSYAKGGKIGDMSITLKDVKIGPTSEESLNYNAKLYVNGKHVADCISSGQGEQTLIRLRAPIDENDKLLREAEKYCEALPPVKYLDMELPMDLYFYVDLLAGQHDKSGRFAKGGSVSNDTITIADVVHTKEPGMSRDKMQKFTHHDAAHPLGDVYEKGGKGYVASGYDWYSFPIKDLKKLKAARQSGEYEKGGKIGNNKYSVDQLVTLTDRPGVYVVRTVDDAGIGLSRPGEQLIMIGLTFDAADKKVKVYNDGKPHEFDLNFLKEAKHSEVKNALRLAVDNDNKQLFKDIWITLWNYDRDKEIANLLMQSTPTESGKDITDVLWEQAKASKETYEEGGELEHEEKEEIAAEVAEQIVEQAIEQGEPVALTISTRTPDHFGSGENINVFGYETRHFDVCRKAVDEFRKAEEAIETGGYEKGTPLYKSITEKMAKLAARVDSIFGIEKRAVEDGYVSTGEIAQLTADQQLIGVYNYGSGMHINTEFLNPHIMEIIARLILPEDTDDVAVSDSDVALKVAAIEEMEAPVAEVIEESPTETTTLEIEEGEPVIEGE